MRLFTHTLKISLILSCLTTLMNAQLEWNRFGTDSYLWTDSQNWLNGEFPGANEMSDILITNVNLGQFQTLSIVLNTGAPQVLRGKMEFQFFSSHRYLPVMDLQGESLIFDGGMLGIKADTATAGQTVTFQNGTVVLGTVGMGGNTASLNLGSDMIAGFASAVDVRMIFAAGAILDTANTAKIQITSNNFNYRQNYTLDLSSADLVSGGYENKISMDSLEVAWFQGAGRTAGRHSEGTLILGASAQEIEVRQDFVLGVSTKTAGDASTTGILEFIPALSGERTLSVGRSLLIGVGDRAIGEVENVPSGLNLYVGSELVAEGDRGVLHIGYNHVTQGSYNSGDTRGTLVGGEGAVKIYVTEMRVGNRTSDYGTTTNGSATGILDLRDSNLEVLDIRDSVIIGEGLNARGEVWLKGGEASSRDLFVGRASGETTGRSLLNLDGTHWIVEEKLEVGALGDIVIRPALSSGGLDLDSDQVGDFSILEGGTITILFDQMPESDSMWGIRVRGDYMPLFNSYLENGRLQGVGEYAALADIYLDSGYTYYGLQAIPEPGVFVLLTGILISGVVISRRYRNRGIRS